MTFLYRHINDMDSITTTHPNPLEDTGFQPFVDAGYEQGRVPWMEVRPVSLFDAFEGHRSYLRFGRVIESAEPAAQPFSENG